jgi:uncharacterized membrane protein YesL
MWRLIREQMPGIARNIRFLRILRMEFLQINSVGLLFLILGIVLIPEQDGCPLPNP